QPAPPHRGGDGHGGGVRRLNGRRSTVDRRLSEGRSEENGGSIASRPAGTLLLERALLVRGDRPPRLDHRRPDPSATRGRNGAAPPGGAAGAGRYPVAP